MLSLQTIQTIRNYLPKHQACKVTELEMGCGVLPKVTLTEQKIALEVSKAKPRALCISHSAFQRVPHRSGGNGFF
jgi:Zn finger protein HypA/HybF involved in hydrogenase expression